MKMRDTALWDGHELTVYDPETKWGSKAGIYIFAGLNHQRKWVPLYIGQCDSFADRMPNHEKWDAAVLLGASHIHASVVPLAADRDRIEKKLIEEFQPRLNTQLR